MKASAQKDPPHDTELVEAIERAKNADTWVSYKNAGNCAFQKKCYLAAVRMYTKALSLLETAQDVETENGERNQVVSQVLSNRSAAYVASPMHAGPSLGLKDAQACVESNRSWYKGYTRVAEAYFAQKKYKEAQGAYEKALEVARQHMCQDDRPTKLMGDSLLQNLEQNVATCIARQKPITEGNERSNQEEAHDWKHRKGPTSRDEIPKTEYEKPWELDSLEGIRAVRAERNDASETHCDERSARKKFNADISEADRVAAQRYKDQLLESFRCNRKSAPAHSDEDTLRSAYPRNAQVTSAACLKNPYEAYTLPTFAHLDKDTFPKDYSHGTDYLGKVITNEALSQKVGGSWGG